MGKEKRLNKKVLLRKEKFEKKEKELINKGFIRVPLFFNPKTLYVKGILYILPFALLSAFLYEIFATSKDTIPYTIECAFWIIMIPVILTFIHEFIHGICFYIFGKNKKEIEFGFDVKSLAPYCTCQIPLTKTQYIIGAIMPTIILGFVPDIISIIMGSSFLHFISFLMILGGMGDILVIGTLLKYNTKGKEVIFIDHPYECGLVAYEKKI